MHNHRLHMIPGVFFCFGRTWFGAFWAAARHRNIVYYHLYKRINEQKRVYLAVSSQRGYIF